MIMDAVNVVSFGFMFNLQIIVQHIAPGADTGRESILHWCGVPASASGGAVTRYLRFRPT